MQFTVLLTVVVALAAVVSAGYLGGVYGGYGLARGYGGLGYGGLSYGGYGAGLAYGGYGYGGIGLARGYGGYGLGYGKGW